MADSANTHDDSIVTPFTTTFDKAAPPQKKARSSKKEKASKTATGAEAPDYEALGVPPERMPEMEDARLASLAIGRLETSQVYEYAGIIARVRGWTEDQKQFDKWSTAIFKLGGRGAHNYIMVHEKLQDDRDRLIALGLPKAALNELAVAEPQKREEIIQLMEAGTKLTAAKIKGMASAGDTDHETSMADAGGVAGVKAQIAKKVSTGVPALMTTGVEILRIILLALEPHRRGKRVEKGIALRQLVLPARLLREQLKWLTWVAKPLGDDFSTTKVHVQPLSRDDRWYELYQTLEQLGGYESWPDAGDVGTWLTETVVPQLEWLLGNHAAKVRTVHMEMERSAEAENAKAPKERAKAKAAAQKSRKKVGKTKSRTSVPAAAESVGTLEAAPMMAAGSGATAPKKPRTRKTAVDDVAAPQETVTGRTAREAESVALPAQPVAANILQSDSVMSPDASKPGGAAFAPPSFLAQRHTKKDANVSAT